jgi:SsrA-binding protein
MSIIDNRKVFHDYLVEERFEAGLQLYGWEVKAIRSKRVSLRESYVIIRKSEIYLFNTHISPLISASSHIVTEAVRSRKLLLHKKEIRKLISKVERSGYTLVPINLHYLHGYIKCEIGLAKGKKIHDKRAVERQRDENREIQVAMKQRQR